MTWAGSVFRWHARDGKNGARKTLAGIRNHTSSSIVQYKALVSISDRRRRKREENRLPLICVKSEEEDHSYARRSPPKVKESVSDMCVGTGDCSPAQPRPPRHTKRAEALIMRISKR